MKIIFTKDITKDIKKIKDKKLIAKITEVIINMEQVSAIEQLAGVKKLSSQQMAFRTRIGDYRLGFFLENDTIILARFLKRADIYKVFP